MDYDYKSFIEVQFPVSKISKESYKERRANLGQTLTGIGKWWGRKPLILVRASILGLLMPSSNDPIRDKEIFLKILTMDNDGLFKRKYKQIPLKLIYEKLTPRERNEYFKNIEEVKGYKFNTEIKITDKQQLQELVFNRMCYDEKLGYCIRPEHVSNLKEETWREINVYLSTKAHSFSELFTELGEKRFGDTPIIGDCFCGGGSIPFETARLGCKTVASDLNPVASLLTWSALNISGSSEDELSKLRKFQDKIFVMANNQVSDWGIERNEKGWLADSYLYCNETICNECGYKVPLSPSWVIGKGTKTIAILKENNETKSFDIKIKSNCSEKEMKNVSSYATVQNYKLYCPHCSKLTPIPAIRKDIQDKIKRPFKFSVLNSLRKWTKEDFKPHPTDIYTERLYCVRYEEVIEDNGVITKKKHYILPSKEDLQREIKVEQILSEYYDEWKAKGYIPSSIIEEGDNNNQTTYERGWKYWHQLFNPRQLLSQGLLMKLIDKEATTDKEIVIGLLGVNKCCDWNSKLCIWNTGVGTEKSQNTFSNQSLNTLFNYGTRSLSYLRNTWFLNINRINVSSNCTVNLKDARQVNDKASIWITDPPYADAVNYHELTEYFLAWDKKMLVKAFPSWYTDSKRMLAVKGVGKSFNQSMVEVYSNLAKNMPDNGMQIVMFTHQDVKVWAELTMILWSAGLRVVSAWNIATETESGGLKKGNYVKGTVLLVLKKQISEETAFQNDLYPEIKAEVKKQIDSMRAIDQGDETNFEDADYLLASYASSLKVLTTYKQIEGIDIKYELSKDRNSKEISPIEEIINKSIKIACDYLIPSGYDKYQWKLLLNEERFYIKGLDIEKNKSYKLGAYQELARGYGIINYRELFENSKANNVRLKTPMEFKNTNLQNANLQNTNFSSTLTRSVVMALYQSVKAQDTMEGKNWLKTELNTMYWKQRTAIIEILSYFSRLEAIEHMEHWHKASEYAKLLKEVIKNDGV